MVLVALVVAAVVVADAGVVVVAVAVMVWALDEFEEAPLAVA